MIDTVGVKIGPYAMVDMFGTPHSPALHVVERYRLLDYADARDAMARNAKENTRTPGADFDDAYRGKVLQLNTVAPRACSPCRGARPSHTDRPWADGRI